MNPFSAYSKLEQSPALESAVLAPTAGLAARYGSGLMARALIGMTLLGKDTATKERAWKRIQEGGGYKSFQNIMTGLGAAAGAAYPMMKNYRKEHTVGENLSKYIDKGRFYKDNPDALHREQRQAFENPPQAVPNYIPGEQKFKSGRSMQKISSVIATWASLFSDIDRKSGLADLLESLDKQASSGNTIENSLMDKIAAHCWVGTLDKEAFYSANSEQTQQAQYNFTQAVIPVHMGRSLVQRDPFLNMYDKKRVDYLMQTAGEGDSGSISGHDLAASAIKAGIGIAAGIAFGKTMGNLFSMDTAQTQRLSTIGAFAGAIYNTGVLK